jgi:GNAT superfamily N-acetyltransferase
MPSAPSTPSYQLRPARREDADFLWSLRRDVMRTVVEKTWGAWDDVQQRKFFDRGFNPGECSIIVVDGRDSGRIDLSSSRNDIFVGIVEILPALQRQGIGSAVMRGLMDEARKAQLPVRLQVLKANPDAKRLYLRLGFKEAGETKTHDLLLYSPPGASTPPWMIRERGDGL